VNLRTLGRWVLWPGMLLLVTFVLVSVRTEAEQSYVPLAYLLVVLGGSIGGGHPLGFTLATASVLLMDYYLQVPYNRVLTFGRRTDFMTLAAFWAVAGVASQLLNVARRERDLALQRAREVAELSKERERLVAEAEHVAALREAEGLKHFLLTSVSHDLRTPLTTLKALAQEEQRTGESRAAEIEQQVDGLSRMVSDLLDLSRLHAGTFGASLELNAAEDVIGAVIRQSQGILNGRRLTAVFDADSPALYGRFDFLLTLRILGNLVENALRLSPEDEVVEVSARRQGRALLIEVSDRGPGVPEPERERIFEPFYRPLGSPPDRGRAGLGLAIARQLALAQGGTVHCRGREGGGSVFALVLEAADVDRALSQEEAP
jgi:K+-sensing histidine kinase KdpD